MFRKYVIRGTILVIAATLTLMLVRVVATPQYDPFDPRYYGLPEYVDGYQILIVTTSENTPCFPAGKFTLTVRSDVQEFDFNRITTFGNQAATALRDLRIPGFERMGSGVGIIGPGNTREQIVQNIERNNRQLRRLGCPEPLGPINEAIFTITIVPESD
jgi:hypothetical protein